MFGVAGANRQRFCLFQPPASKGEERSPTDVFILIVEELLQQRLDFIGSQLNAAEGIRELPPRVWPCRIEASSC